MDTYSKETIKLLFGNEPKGRLKKPKLLNDGQGNILRIVHTADWHLSNRGTIAGRFILQEGMNLTLLDRVKAIGGIIEYVEENDIDLVVIAGDLFNHSNPEDIARYVAMEAIERLAEQCPVVILKGNHDGAKGSEIASALTPFGNKIRRSGVYISERPESFPLLTKGRKINIFTLPYPRTSALKSDPQLKSMSPEEVSAFISCRMEEILSGFSAIIEHDAVNILVGHFTETGSVYSKEQNVPPFDISIREEFLDPFDIACLGHLHTPQPYYSGTIARNGFGEQDMKVGFKIHKVAIGIGNKKICDVDEEFIELPAREYVTFSPEDFMNNGQINPEVVVRIKGKVPKYQYDDLVRRMKALNHPFLKNALEIELETAGSMDDRGTSEEPDVEEALRMWAKGREGVDKFIDRLVVKGKEIEEKFQEAKP